MRGALGGPRVLLRRLREVMAEPVSAQDRLDKVVVLIAANMVAEVCSVYVLRVDGTLELYATEGLKREAVHQTVLKADEGLVGLVSSEANPINLSDAQAHPAFSYRAETGEEIYHSFLGVPILRAGNTLGVLVVQNRARRTYTEEEEEALQTTAMVLAEMIASGELSSLARPGAEPVARHAMHLTGSSLSDGIALGHVVLHEPRVVVTNVIADDVQHELKRLDAAIATLREDLDRLVEHRDIADGGEHRDVLEAYRMRGRGNHRKSQNPLTRVYESNGPDVKIRGTASHIAEKYIQLARDAQGSGDPVAAENYYQHAEHYFRLIAAAQEQFRQQNPYYNQQPQQGAPGGQHQQGNDESFDGDDDDGQTFMPPPIQRVANPFLALRFCIS